MKSRDAWHSEGKEGRIWGGEGLVFYSRVNMELEIGDVSWHVMVILWNSYCALELLVDHLSEDMIRIKKSI